MTRVQGFDFEKAAQDGSVDWDAFGTSLATSGFEATQTHAAGECIRRMVQARKEGRTKILLAFTSNLISAGSREVFNWLARTRQIDVVITTAGGVEEDFIKCLGKTYLGDFALPGKELRKKGLNRIANLLVPNDNYCKFETWFVPVINQMKKEQDEGTHWTPSRLIHRAGLEIKDGTSFYNQCAHNDIPVFSPSVSDGSIGDMLFFDSYKVPGFVVDTAGDLELLADAVSGAPELGVICLGGGLPKYHALLASKLAKVPVSRFVLVNTGQQFDGSETGMEFEDDISWGRLGEDCDCVRLHTEATIALPMLARLGFALEG